MKVEYKEHLYIKYLKQRLMFLYGWVDNYKIDKNLFYKLSKEDLKKLNQIKDINKLENMLKDIKDFYSIDEDEARNILELDNK